MTSLLLGLVISLWSVQAQSRAPEPTEVAEPAVVEEEPPRPTRPITTFENDPIGVQQIVLDNGLVVMLSENHERPEVFGAVVVRTGGKNDPADNTGMAHYLEHMLFKGTTRMGTTDWAKEKPLQERIEALYEEHKQAKTDADRARIQKEIGDTVKKTYGYAIPNELDRMLGEIGGTGVNAFTSEDETVYHNTFPASQIENWLDIYAHRFADPVFRLFPTELETVYEEKNISMDRFESQLIERYLRRAFPEHPYGTQTVIGEVEHLKRPSLRAMREYFERFYVPNDMALVLAGDFDTAAVIPLIEDKFGVWPRGPEPEPRTGKVEPFQGRELVRQRVTPVRVGAFGFRTVPSRSDDYAALLVARELLFNEQRSGYLDRLGDEGKLLIVLPVPLQYAEHGLDVVFFVPKIVGQSFRRAEKLVLEQFGRIRRGEFDEAEMEAVRDALRRGEDRQWEDNEERALAMADAFIRRPSWKDYLEFRAQLAEVSREDVMRVAKKYFDDDYLALRSRMGFPKKPRLAKPSYPPVKPKPGRRSQYYEEVMSRPQPPTRLRYVDLDKDITTTEVRPGVTLHTNANPFNDTYTLELRFGVGTDGIRELSVAADYLGRIGSTAHDPVALRRELFLIGTTLSVEATLDRFVVTLEGPEEHMSRALMLVDELMHRPRADKKRLRQLRRERQGGERVARRDPGYIAEALREYAFYGERSSYLRDYGRRGLRKLSAEDLLGAWKRAQAHAVEIRYVGQRPPDEVAEKIRRSIHLADALKPAVPYVVYPRVLPNEPTVYFLKRRDALQSQLWFAVEGDPVPAEKLAAADAYGEYIGGGMAGLVFQEVREFRALAYSAAARYVRDATPEQDSFLGGYVGCQADKTMETVSVMTGLFGNMPSKPDRMEALRSSLLRTQETESPGFRDLQATVEDWRRRGHTEDARKALLAGYEKLAFSDVESFYAAQIKGRPITIAVVGDPRRVDVDALRRHGKIVKVTERDIFPR